MLLVALVLLVIGLVYYLLIEPFRNRRARIYRPNMLVVPVLAALLLPVGYFEIKWQWMEHKGTQIVREVSGKEDASLKCQRLANTLFDTKLGYDGYVSHDKPLVATMKWRPCMKLQSYFSWPKNPSLEESTAFNVLLHESAHVSGEWDETAAECKAHAQHVHQAERLGTRTKTAYLNLRLYIKSIYPNLGKKYVSADGCSGLHESIMQNSTMAQ